MNKNRSGTGGGGGKRSISLSGVNELGTFCLILGNLRRYIDGKIQRR